MTEPIFKLKLSPAAWQLLWWLIARMDNRCEIRGAWRNMAAKEIGGDRFWLHRCAKQLKDAGLLESPSNGRWAKVHVELIIG